MINRFTKTLSWAAVFATHFSLGQSYQERAELQEIVPFHRWGTLRVSALKYVETPTSVSLKLEVIGDLKSKPWSNFLIRSKFEVINTSFVKTIGDARIRVSAVNNRPGTTRLQIVYSLYRHIETKTRVIDLRAIVNITSLYSILPNFDSGALCLATENHLIALKAIRKVNLGKQVPKLDSPTFRIGNRQNPSTIVVFPTPTGNDSLVIGPNSPCIVIFFPAEYSSSTTLGLVCPPEGGPF